MNLLQYYNHKVLVESSNERLIQGSVTDYFYPEDNENGMESIAIKDQNGEYVELYESDIKSIEIV